MEKTPILPTVEGQLSIVDRHFHHFDHIIGLAYGKAGTDK
jgi:hypothetical protein